METTIAANDWSIVVHDLDSHPIRRELGIGDQEAALAFDIETDFVVHNGFPLGHVAAPGGPLPVPVPSRLDGDGSLIESAARWLLHEIGTLERSARDLLKRL